MSFCQRGYEFVENDVTVHFNDHGAVDRSWPSRPWPARIRSPSWSAFRRLSAPGPISRPAVAVGTALPEILWPRASELPSGSKDRDHQHHCFACRIIEWVPPEWIANILEVNRRCCRFKGAACQVDPVKFRSIITERLQKVDRMNEPRIRICFRPHLESFCDWSRAFRKAIPDLKCVGEPGKFGIEIGGKPVGRNAEAAFQPIALGGADLANPAILQHSQDR